MLFLSKTYLAIALTIAVLLLASCSQPPKPSGSEETTTKPAEAASPTEPVTAKTAFLPLYKSAYKWAGDVLILNMSPKEIPGFTNADGKAAMWQVTFASPHQHVYRVFTYAIAAHSPDIYKGVTIGNSIPWAGVTRDVMPVATADFAIDSDAAYAAAAADAEAWLKKNPDKKLTRFELGNADRFPAPIWYVMWGDKNSGYVAVVNATTGKIIKK